MRKFVISLLNRPDRKVHFEATNRQLTNWEYFEAFDGKALKWDKVSLPLDRDWRDPGLHRPATKGELACSLSHIEMWKKCIELNEPIMIIEDDAVFSQEYFLENKEKELENINFEYDIVYLNHNELKRDQAKKLDDTWSVPCFPYNLTAYVMTPHLARKMMVHITHLIPTDEILANLVEKKEVKALTYHHDVVWPGQDLGSTTHESNPDYFGEGFNVHILSCATDEKQFEYLETSAFKQGINVINLAKDREWTGGDMTFPGGGMKINLVKEYIKDLPESDIILFMDGHDVVVFDTLNTILAKYFNTKKEILFAGEKEIWPSKPLATFFGEGTYPYLNSGCYIGLAGSLRRMFERHCPDDADDQEYCQLRYAESDPDVVGIDEECLIFQCYDHDNIYIRNDIYKNTRTGNYFSIYHANGSNKQDLDVFSKRVHTRQKVRYLDDDILMVNFLAPAECREIIQLADDKGYENLDGDSYPGMESRLSKLGIHEKIQTKFNELHHIIWDEWKQSIDIRASLNDGFVIKYDANNQTALDLHHDTSIISGAVKLNDDYEGGELYFPRQNVSNKDVPVGWIILWPGKVTHPHMSKELISGTKYSMILWSKV